MYKVNSIKQLLQRWSSVTVLAFVFITLGGIYSNILFSGTQQVLAEKVIPVTRLSYEAINLVGALARREEYSLVSNSLDTTAIDLSRQKLEQQFNLNWRKLLTTIEDNETQKVADKLWEDYQRFLRVNDRLIAVISAHQVGVASIEKKVLGIESLKRQNADAFLVLAKQTAGSIESQRQVIAAYKSLELEVLKVNNLIAEIEKQNNAGLTSLSIEIKRSAGNLPAILMPLKAIFKDNSTALKSLETIVKNVQLMKVEAIEGEASLYQLQFKQLGNTQKLVRIQKTSRTAIDHLLKDLNALSDMINQQGLETINSSLSKAKKISWIMIALTLLAIIGMINFILSMSRSVNKPLTEVRNAMHALSSSKFETRLDHKDYANEFRTLATDFNQFASKNQLLIEDLDNAKQSLQQQQAQLRIIFDGVPEAIITLDASGIIESINPYAEQVLKANEKSLLGVSITRFFEKSEQINTIDELLKKQDKTKQFKGLDCSDQPFSMWLSLNPILDDKRQRFVCVLSDVTSWKKTEQQLKQTSSELDTILENAMVGIAFMKDQKLLRVNHKFEELFGYKKEEIIGQTTRELCTDNEMFEQLNDRVFSQLEEGDAFEGDVQFVKQSGELFWCSLSTKAVSPRQPQEGTIWLFENITIQRENEEKLRDLANLDGLTGLPNRSVFNDRLMHAIHKAQRNAKRLAIFFLDIDHFKNINDSLGHKAGDQLLCEVAKRLKSCIREGDTVARLGGDEFTLILEDIQSVQYVAKIAEKVIASVCRSYRLGSIEVNVSPSIGISLYPSDGRDVDVLVRNADAAMYHAKNTGRNNFQFYSAEMNAQAAHRLAMETSLRRAVEQQDFYLHFQPQIDISNNRIMGAEVLLRWHSQDWGEVSPAEFIPILEDTGLIGKVGERVLLDACEAYMSLRDKLDPDFKIAVNLSGRQFKGTAPLAVYVRTVLDKTGMSAQNLELEITESILMEDTHLAIRTLSDLSELGVTLAVDDFGTGYSSLSYLKQFPINVLKIDKSFIDDVTDEGDDAAIVDAILAMSGHLNLEVVAEGIETIEQLKFLQQRQCQKGQGYFFSRPLNFEAFESLIENDKIAANN